MFFPWDVFTWAGAAAAFSAQPMQSFVAERLSCLFEGKNPSQTFVSFTIEWP